ncbi:MAG: hypothetical protein F4Y22_09725 [Gammaproteobacteria bacterium]|nr:hypothetical protein [Gammaproteobacteria bacterium]
MPQFRRDLAGQFVVAQIDEGQGVESLEVQRYGASQAEVGQIDRADSPPVDADSGPIVDPHLFAPAPLANRQVRGGRAARDQGVGEFDYRAAIPGHPGIAAGIVDESAVRAAVGVDQQGRGDDPVGRAEQDRRYCREHRAVQRHSDRRDRSGASGVYRVCPLVFRTLEQLVDEPQFDGI